MRIPKGYIGPILLDNGQGPVYRLSSEQKAISKQIVSLISPIVTKSIAKSVQTNKLITTMIILLGVEQHTPAIVHTLFKHVRFFQLAQEGKLVSPLNVYKLTNKDIKLIGMDNFHKTTCYLDALIVSMFHSTSVFDFLLTPIADPNLSSELQLEVEELKIVLRFIVNLIRSGQFINSNIMYQLLLVLNSLGCEIALSGTQQDSLQMFTFLVECLSLPLLTFKLAVIHNGKLNVSDDLKLIEERILLISVPSNFQTNEPPIELQDCLDKYFNNSVTVRRIMDKKLNSNSFTMDPNIVEGDTSAIEDDISLSDITNDHSEMHEYEKQGILQSIPCDCKNDDETKNTQLEQHPDVNLTPTPMLKQLLPEEESISLESLTTKLSPASTLSNSAVNTNNKSTIVSTNKNISNSPTLMQTPSKSPTLDSILNFTGGVSGGVSMDTNESGSFRNVTEKLTHQRTRSSTLVSKLNNVIPSNPNRITRRPSSISNTEVSLPAWMYMQILPYYTDPNVKLTVENHEDFYRSRTTRSKTIDSSQYDPKASNDNDTFLSPFETKFGSHRPIVPICLKKYTWNERGQSVKIKRKVIIPEIIMYPFFIAEDRTKIGYVDFKRTKDFKSPCGSFMLVLQSCVCHRGNNVNSGHYVSISRKHKYNPNIPQKDEWILFNDMEAPSEKTKTFTFNKIMDMEDPYILFYEIVELKSNTLAILPPNGSNELFWSGNNTRKPSVISGTSDGTIIEDHTTQSSILDDFKINLSGLSKSKSKCDFDDVLEEYWFNFEQIYCGTNTSINTIIPESIAGEHSSSSIESNCHKQIVAATQSSLNNDDAITARVIVTELNDSMASTNTEDLSNDTDSGVLEYATDEIQQPQLNVNIDNESLANTKSNRSWISAKSKETIKVKKKHGNRNVIGKLLKKVFN